jgi:hypothetical protein
MSWQIWDPPAIIIPAPPKAEIQIPAKESISKEEHYRKIYDTPWNKLQPDGRINMDGNGTAASISPYSKHYRSQVEDGIWPLVNVLHQKGYLTVSSCAGHRGNIFKEFDDGFFSYNSCPYVMIVVNRICVNDVVKELQKHSTKHVEISSTDSMAGMDASGSKPKRSKKKDIQNEYESLNYMMQRNYDEWSYIIIRINPWKKYSFSYVWNTQRERKLIDQLVVKINSISEYIF